MQIVHYAHSERIPKLIPTKIGIFRDQNRSRNIPRCIFFLSYSLLSRAHKQIFLLMTSVKAATQPKRVYAPRWTHDEHRLFFATIPALPEDKHPNRMAGDEPWKALEGPFQAQGNCPSD